MCGWLGMRMRVPGPALEGGDDEEGEHGLEHVVVVERVPVPLPLLYDRFVDVRVPASVHHFPYLAWQSRHVLDPDLLIGGPKSSECSGLGSDLCQSSWI